MPIGYFYEKVRLRLPIREEPGDNYSAGCAAGRKVFIRALLPVFISVFTCLYLRTFILQRQEFLEKFIF